MKKILLLLAFSILMISLSSRAKANNSKLSISGTLRNDKNWAIEFANIAVYHDSTLITGTVSDYNGNFMFELYEFGEYSLKISHLSYVPYSETIKIDCNDKQLGSIILSKLNSYIGEVLIKADKVLHEKGIREDVFNISNSMRDNSGSVRELLLQVPTLHVSRENNISVEGEGNVLVLVNGRPYYDTNPLNLLTPKQIKKVTVNTTPEVDIVNDGYSSVVNILLKKEQKHSINGNFNYVLPNDLLNQVDGSLNLYKARWRLFGGYSLYSQTSAYTTDQIVYDELSVDTIFNYANNSIKPRHRQKYFGGVDLFLNERNTLGFATNLKTLHRREIFHELNIKNRDSISKSIGQDHTDYSNLQASLFYKNRTLDKKKLLTLELLHSQFIRDKANDFSRYEFNNQSFRLSFDSAEIDRKSIKARIKYKMKLANSAKLTLGVNYYNEDSYNKFVSSVSNHRMDYSNDRTTVFADYSYGKNKFSYWASLGYEYNDRKINSQLEVNHVFYPNLGASYSYTKKLSSTISYQKRIHHPSIYQLDPFEYVSGVSTIVKGNSSLTDYYTHSIKIATRYRWKRSYLKMNLFYDYTADAVSEISTFNSEGIQVKSYNNLASLKRTGIKLNISWQPNKWLRLGNRTSFYNEEIKDKAYKDNILTTDVLSYFTLYLPRNIILFVHYFNRPEKLISNGKISNSQSFNYGVSKYFFDKKLELCVNLLNQFFPYETTSVFKSGSSISKSKTRRDMRTVMFSVFYNFSSKKKMNKKARSRIHWEDQGKEDVI